LRSTSNTSSDNSRHGAVFSTFNTCALAALAVVSAASAQSTITISGQVAAAYERSSAANADAGITGYDSSSNNITFSGTEDLGGGLKAGFLLNKRFDVSTGQTSNSGVREWQNASVYLSSATLGTVAVGRILATSFAAYDPFGQLGAEATTAYASNSQVGNRNDRAVQYTSPTFRGFKLNLHTTANPAVNDKEDSMVRVDYTNGPLSLSAGYEKNAVTVSAPAAGSAAAAASDRKDKTVAAMYDFGMVKASIVWSEAGDNTSRTSVHAVVPVNAAVKLLASFRAAGNESTAAPVGDSAYALGAEYALSKRTVAFAHFGDSGEAASQTAYRVGLRHSF
jgi:predicted porin